MRAQIVTPAGERIDGDVANLTATGLLLLCDARPRIGQSLTAKLLSHSMPAQVLFVSEAPAGVVISLRPKDDARDAILEAAPSVQVVAPKDELWSEDTSSTNVDLPPEALQAIEPAVDDLVVFEPPVESGPATPTTDAVEPINPVLLAAASMDDSADLEPVTAEPATAEPADLELADMTPLAEEEPLHVPDLPDIASVPDIVAPAEAAAPTNGDPTLPTLGDDGHTVHFESSDAYIVQYSSNIEHGGLVVKANALPIGTQRMLELEVPGSDKYTVSARVIYHQDGKVGFMLDSFNIHKARLKQLGD